MGSIKKCINISDGKPEEIDNLGEPGVDGRIIY
jgi:hypothetical protein